LIGLGMHTQPNFMIPLCSLFILSSKNNYTFSSSFSPLGVYVCHVEIIFFTKERHSQILSIYLVWSMIQII